MLKLPKIQSVRINYERGGEIVFYRHWSDGSDSAYTIDVRKTGKDFFELYADPDSVTKDDIKAAKAAIADHTEAEGYSDIVEAVENNDIEAVKTFLDKGANVNAEKSGGLSTGWTLLGLASRRSGSAEIVKLLLKSGADIHTGGGGGSALHIAAAQGRIDIVKVLLEAGAEINRKDFLDGDTALKWAEKQGHHDIVALLKEHGGT